MKSLENYLRLRKAYLSFYSICGYLLLGIELWRLRGFISAKIPEICVMAVFLAFATFLDVPIPRLRTSIQFIYPVYALGILLLKGAFIFPYFISNLLGRLGEKPQSYLAAAWGPARMVPVILFSSYVYRQLGGSDPLSLNQVTWLPFAVLTLCLALFDGLSANVSETLAAGMPPWKYTLPLAAFLDVPFTPLSIPLYLFYRNEGLATFVIFSIPLAAVCWLLRQFLVQTTKKEESVGLLNMANELISSSLDFKVMVEKISEKIKEIMDADGVEFFLKQEEGWNLEFSTGIDRGKKELSLLLDAKLKNSPIIFRDIREDPEFSSYKENGFFSVLFVPLFSDKEITGCIICSKRIPDYFFSEHLEFSKIFSSQVSAALYGAKLHQKLLKTLDELRQTQEQLVQSEKMAGLGKLAAGVAHEINNPLGAILLNAETLLLDPKDKEAIELIIDSAKKSKEIVEGLLSFSRQSKSQEQIIDFKNLLLENLRIWKKQFELEEIQIQTKISGNPKAYGKPQELAQVIFNLLSNARDAIIELETKKGIISINLSETPTGSLLEIKDTGCGISEENLPKILEPFFTTKEVGKGTGLGLSVSYGIVASMKGKIEVKSKIGEGTTVLLAFPKPDSSIDKSTLVEKALKGF